MLGIGVKLPHVISQLVIHLQMVSFDRHLNTSQKSTWLLLHARAQAKDKTTAAYYELHSGLDARALHQYR